MQFRKYRYILLVLFTSLIYGCVSPGKNEETKEFQTIQDSLNVYFEKINYNPPQDYILFIEPNIVCKGCLETKKIELEKLVKTQQISLPVVFMCEQPSVLAWADSLGFITRKLNMNDFEGQFPYYANLNLYIFQYGELKYHRELGVPEINIPLSEMIKADGERI